MTNPKLLGVGLVSVIAPAGCDAGTGMDAGDDMTSASPAVTSETDLTCLEGSRAGQAQMNIINLIRSDGSTNYWLNRANGSCASITTSDGRYSIIDMLPAGDC